MLRFASSWQPKKIETTTALSPSCPCRIPLPIHPLAISPPPPAPPLSSDWLGITPAALLRLLGSHFPAPQGCQSPLTGPHVNLPADDLQVFILQNVKELEDGKKDRVAHAVVL